MISVYTNDLVFYYGITQLLKPVVKDIQRSPANCTDVSSSEIKISLFIVDMHGLTFTLEEMLQALENIKEHHPSAKVLLIATRINKVTYNTLCKFNKEISVVSARSFFEYCMLKFSQTHKTPPSNIIGNERAALTKREIQVLKYIATGNPLKRISSATNLNEKTISYYKCSIMRKYGCNNMLELKKVMEELGYYSF
ncbi:LuxR C-terminal-related transcriptional regulator [Enterobacter quasiroggenkampii]|uniref:LuxR C-terminal-related transcriptional regulator n=1 Tax=Enterobacter quasiroggenkampii TaxID=2497436 RepID=UPI0021CE9AF4|nr:LuxR C-terminal-related transcriptional regulator [Enterobacter quasiroggenkampii]MCU6368492.1 LuxR C-terminal-related transcriptional regulator [Enterobacter quasiroggenkampii]